MLSRKAKLIKRTSGLSKGTLLDIGTGTGYFSNAMKERGWRVKAIEKSPQARSFAKEHFELDVDTEDALAGYADHSFDAITLWHVMEHLEHLNETWEKLFKLLKERGVLIVAVPNPCLLYTSRSTGLLPRKSATPCSVIRILTSCSL